MKKQSRTEIQCKEPDNMSTEREREESGVVSPDMGTKVWKQGGRLVTMGL